MQPAVETEPRTNNEAAKPPQIPRIPAADQMLELRRDAVGLGVFDRLCVGCFKGLADIQQRWETGRRSRIMQEEAGNVRSWATVPLAASGGRRKCSQQMPLLTPSGSGGSNFRCARIVDEAGTQWCRRQGVLRMTTLLWNQFHTTGQHW